MSKKSLIAFFSRKGYNYYNGHIENLKVGNTEIVANMIKEITSGDLFKIETVQDYPIDYKETTEVAKKELEENDRPELKQYLENIDEYDTIYLGYPDWWGTMPMAVYTFLEKYDFSNKVIRPFCTHEGSGMGHSENDIKKLCPNANVKKGLAIHGTDAKDSKSSVENWINLK